MIVTMAPFKRAITRSMFGGGVTLPSSYILHLYGYTTTPPTLVASMTTSSLTEVSGSGYATKALTLTSFTHSGASETAAATYPTPETNCIFQFTVGGVKIGGYYVTGSINLGDGTGAQTYLLWAEQRIFTTTANGDAYIVPVKYTIA